MKFMTPSDPFWATAPPLRGKYSVKPAPPEKGTQRFGYTLARYWVNCAVDPEPSEWTTGTMGIGGRARPLLSAVTAGSSQLVIWFVKIFASVWPERRRSEERRVGKECRSRWSPY